MRGSGAWALTAASNAKAALLRAIAGQRLERFKQFNQVVQQLSYGEGRGESESGHWQAVPFSLIMNLV